MNLKEGYVSLHGVRVFARHGVLPQEQITGGEFVISVKVRYPIDRALESDDVADTLNYATLLEIINKTMQRPSRLLEHVAGRMAHCIFNAFPLAEELWISITKVNPPMPGQLEGAEVSIHVYA